MLEQVLGDGPALISTEPDPESLSGDDGDDHTAGPAPDEEADTTTAPNARFLPAHELDSPRPGEQVTTTPVDVNAGAKRTLLWLGSGVVLVAVLIVMAFLVFGGGPTPVASPQHKPAATQVVVAVPTTSDLPAPPQDQAIPFDPTTDSCPGGPTSPLALTDTSTDSAWVCSRGPQESRLDGQILRVKFMCDRSRPESTCSYMLNSVSITPGWVAKTPGGKDEWLAHRVVSRLQYVFNDTDRTVLTQDTANTHGPVTTPLPHKLLASRVTVAILQTARPPASPLPSPEATGPVLPGFGDSALGPDGAPLAPDATASAEPVPLGEQDSDPVDATFAISALKFLGHEPN